MGLERVFADEPAFIPYVAAGDPTYEESLEYVEALERGGADVIELGLPFSEPIAEGSTIQEAVVRSLEGGMTPDRYFEFVKDLDVDVPLVCMTYYNLVAQYTHPATGETGPPAFAQRASEVGIEGFVVVDLPAEEAGPLREACDEFGQDLVFIIAPTTKGERLERMQENVSGYVYVQARLGVTGARDDVSDQTEASLARVADWDVPKAVGFGIKTGEHAERIVAAGADGIIVGSALVDIIADGADPEVDQPFPETAQRIESKARELKEGALAGAETQAATEQSD
ncbi:MAG: tryptophan synthase subunit alpha [Halobacteriales archaeon]